MPRVTKNFVTHPKTGERLSLTAAAAIIGIARTTLVRRVSIGDTGDRLWRAGGSERAPNKKSGENKVKQADALRKIPGPTKFDEMFSNRPDLGRN